MVRCPRDDVSSSRCDCDAQCVHVATGRGSGKTTVWHDPAGWTACADLPPAGGACRYDKSDNSAPVDVQTEYRDVGCGRVVCPNGGSSRPLQPGGSGVDGAACSASLGGIFPGGRAREEN